MTVELENKAPRSRADEGQERYDRVFQDMVEKMEELAALSEDVEAGVFRERMLELEAIRDGILGELLEEHPYEAISEVIHSLSLIYEQRSLISDDGTTRMFATRDNETNSWLDDHYTITKLEDGSVSYDIEVRNFRNNGYTIRATGDRVDLYTVAGTYRIPASPTAETPDGSPNQYQRTLREFYLRALSTASVAVQRRETDPRSADEADAQARGMLGAELAV